MKEAVLLKKLRKLCRKRGKKKIIIAITNRLYILSSHAGCRSCQSPSITISVVNLTAFFVWSEELRGDESGDEINDDGREAERELGRKRAMRDLNLANERGEWEEEGVRDARVDVAEALEKGGLIAGLPDDEVADIFMEDRVGGGGRMSEVVLWWICS
jgi:hypothetical protein